MKRTNNKLQSQDLTEIKKLLPYDWRLQISKGHPELTTRQISEAFYLRTRNPEHTEIVFSVIAQILSKLRQPVLARKCRHRIMYCKSMQIAA